MSCNDSHPRRARARYPLLAACVIAALSGAPGGVLAADDSLDKFFEDFPVVLSASRLKQSAVDAPAAVTVIDRDMIVASGARRIVDVLRLVPGFYVGYLNGNSTVVAYHGLSDYYAKRMQVLVDGVSIYSPLLGGVEWTDLPLTLQDIERIEVVRGPNAVTYGANAFLGVINIITRDPATEAGVEVASNIGGNGIRDLVARASGHGESLRYSVSLSQRNDDGYVELPDSSRISLVNLHAHYRVNPADELTLQIRASGGQEMQGHSIAQGFYKLNIGPGQFDPERQRALGQETVQLRWTRAFSADDEFWLQGYHHQRRLREPATVTLPLPGGASMPYTYDSNFEVTRDDVEFQSAQRLADTLRLAWGAQWREDGAKSWALLNSESWLTNRLTRLFGNLEYRPGSAMTLHAGTMFEHNSMSGSSVSPRLAATYALAPGHTLRVGISRANRAPTINEESGSLIYASPPALQWLTHGTPLTILSMSSGNLRDERILSREVGYVAEIPEYRLSGDIRIFNDQVNRLIVLTATRPVVTMTNNLTWDYVNSPAPARVSGIELSARWRPWNGALIHASAAHTRIDSDITDATESAPSPTFSLLFSQALPQDLSFSAGYYQVGRMKWQSSSASLAAYGTLDLRLARQFRFGAQRLEVALVTRNALGSYTDYKPEFPERRTSFLQLNWSY